MLSHENQIKIQLVVCFLILVFSLLFAVGKRFDIQQIAFANSKTWMSLNIAIALVSFLFLMYCIYLSKYKQHTSSHLHIALGFICLQSLICVILYSKVGDNNESNEYIGIGFLHAFALVSILKVLNIF